MRTILLLITLLTLNNLSFAQSPNYTIGGLEIEFYNSAFKTSTGFIAFVDSRSGISGDKTIDNNSNLRYNVWVIEFDENMNITNQKVISGDDQDRVGDVIQTNDSGFIISIESGSDIGFDKSVNYYGNGDIWLVKLDSQLNIVWQKSYGTTGFDAFSTITEDENGTIYVACSSDGADGNRSVSKKGSVDTWLIKLDSSGNEIWQKSYGGSNYEYYPYLTINENDDITLAMSSNSNASLDKTSNSINNTNDIWILQLDSSGTIINQKTIGTNEEDYISCFRSVNNELLLGSTTNATSSGDKNSTGYGGYDVWLLNLNDTLGIKWQNTLGGLNDESISDVYYSSARNTLFASCTSNSGQTGMKNTSNVGSSDYWLVELNMNGNVINQYGAGGYLDDGLAQVVESNGLLYGFGNSGSDAGGDKTDPLIGGGDIWIVTFDVALSAKSVNTETKSISAYPNPVSSTLNVVGLEDYTSYSIYSISGQLINQGYTNNAIDVSNLNNGIYFLEIEGYTTQKIVVE